MQLFKTSFYRQCYQSLIKAIEEQDTGDWNSILKDANLPFFDGFLILQTYPNLNKWLKKFGFASINDWLMDAENWHKEILDASNDSTGDVIVLVSLWMNFKERIQELLRKARLNANIPNAGGALVYVDGISKCLIVNYIFRDTGTSKLNDTSKPVIKLVDIIDDPKSVFDFWGIINQRGMLQKNMLKEILSTGHKILIHRDTLIHVDRRNDIQVFGPSIDTLLLSEIIAQGIYEGGQLNCESALEVGCGNGLLTVSLAKNCHTLKELYSCDINFNALNCTDRNLKGVVAPAREKKFSRYLIAGAYNGKMINKKFDLIVCNPPYIPLHVNNQNNDGVANFFQAVGGLEVIDEILETLPLNLNEKGRLLLLVSNLSLDYTLSKIPNGYTYELIIETGFEVPFDVEAVLSKQEWLAYLIKECGMIEKKGNYFHSLHPMWIYKN